MGTSPIGRCLCQCDWMLPQYLHPKTSIFGHLPLRSVVSFSYQRLWMCWGHSDPALTILFLEIIQWARMVGNVFRTTCNVLIRQETEVLPPPTCRIDGLENAWCGLVPLSMYASKQPRFHPGTRRGSIGRSSFIEMWLLGLLLIWRAEKQ